MHSDLLRWWALLNRIRAGDEQVRADTDNEAVSGAQSVRKGNKEGGQVARVIIDI